MVGITRTEDRPSVCASPQQARAGEAPRCTARAPAMPQRELLVCPRTPGCTKPPGHAGFCIGHKLSPRGNSLKEKR